MTKTSQAYFEIGKTSPVYMARWKPLKGSGRDALYRALCGVQRDSGFCLGHLGDLTYFWPRAVSSGEALKNAIEVRAFCEKVGIEWCQEAMPHLRDMTSEEAMTRLREAERLHGIMSEGPGYETRTGHPGPHEGWQMVASLMDFKRNRKNDRSGLLVYRGYPDSGYLKTQSKRWEIRSGRRSVTGTAAAMFGPRWIQGQHVVPPCRIRCPECGELNAVDWPEPLADPEAR